MAPVSDEWVQARLKDARWVATARQRLQSLSWFMKCLKEPLSRLANREEQTRGAFFEGRFKSVAILDEESLLATCADLDLNPVAAGIAEVPESSAHTSIKRRVEHVKEQGRTENLNAAQAGSVAGSTGAVGLEEGLWLCPVEDRRRLDSAREGMLEGFSLGNYVLLVEKTPGGCSARVASELGWATQFVRRAGRPNRETGCVPVSVPLALVDFMSHKIHLWSEETPELQKELPGHPIGIASLTFTPDGKKFASAGFDRTRKL